MNARFMVMCFTVVLAASAYGQTSFVPIGELKVKGLMGGVENGRWIAPARAAKLMSGRTEFVLIGKQGVEEGGVTFGRLSQPEDPCDDFYPLEFELKMDLGVAIGSVAKWNPMPRMPKEISLENKTYRNIVAGYLRGKGIANPVVRLTRAFRIDLDGDGTEEVLISATHFKYGVEPRAARGDYSFVMLRTARGRRVTNHLLAGDFLARAVKFGAPSQHDISAVADLNGDGKMEVVLDGFYYEGDFASAYEMKNGRPAEIREFRIACGV